TPPSLGRLREGCLTSRFVPPRDAPPPPNGASLKMLGFLVWGTPLPESGLPLHEAKIDLGEQLGGALESGFRGNSASSRPVLSRNPCRNRTLPVLRQVNPESLRGGLDLLQDSSSRPILWH